MSYMRIRRPDKASYYLQHFGTKMSNREYNYLNKLTSKQGINYVIKGLNKKNSIDNNTKDVIINSIDNIFYSELKLYLYEKSFFEKEKIKFIENEIWNNEHILLFFISNCSFAPNNSIFLKGFLDDINLSKKLVQNHIGKNPELIEKYINRYLSIASDFNTLNQFGNYDPQSFKFINYLYNNNHNDFMNLIKRLYNEGLNKSYKFSNKTIESVMCLMDKEDANDMYKLFIQHKDYDLLRSIYYSYKNEKYSIHKILINQDNIETIESIELMFTLNNAM